MRGALLAAALLAASAGPARAESEAPRILKTIDCPAGEPTDSLVSQCLHMRLRTGDIDAGRVLSNRKEAAAVGPLRKIAEDPKAPLGKRGLALQYLGRLPYDPRVLEALSQALRSEDLREAAMEGLAMQGTPGRRVLLRLLRRPPAGQDPCIVAMKLFDGFLLGTPPHAPDAEVIEAAGMTLDRTDCAPVHERALGAVTQARSLAPIKASLPILAKALAAADRGGYDTPEGGPRLAQHVFYFLQENYVEGHASLLPRLRSCAAIAELRGLVDGIPYEAFRRRTAVEESRKRDEMFRQSNESRHQGDGEALRVDGTTPELLKK